MTSATRCYPPQPDIDVVSIIDGIGTRHAGEVAGVATLDWSKVNSVVPAGQRYAVAIQVARDLYGRLSRHPKLVAALLRAWNSQWCRPPVIEADIDRIVAATARLGQLSLGFVPVSASPTLSRSPQMKVQVRAAPRYRRT